MGTTFRIILYAPDLTAANSGAKAAFARVAELEQILSDYKADSEVMKLCKTNDANPGNPIPISDDLVEVMSTAQDVSGKCEGAFDVTIGPLSRLWRQTRKSKMLPSEAQLNEAKSLVNWKKVTLDAKAKTLRLDRAGMRLDFGGIGKGFAADAALAVLKKQGIASALVAASGDIVVSAAPPGRDGWLVEVAPINPKDPPRKLQLTDMAVSTSGDLFQHVEIGGVRYSHVIDPKSGLGLTGFRSATVVAKSGANADAWAKAAGILPPEQGFKLIEDNKGAAFLAMKEKVDSIVNVEQSPSFSKHVVK